MTPAGIAALMVVADRVAASFADDGTADQRDIDRLVRAGFLVRAGRSRFEFNALGAIAVHLSSQVAALSADLEAARATALDEAAKLAGHLAGFGQSSNAIILGKNIAEAIRALKEKP
jgi:outer membrane murein-binding lipoprotein Lpp